MRQIVQSTTTVRTTRSNVPDRRPADLKAYGWPMMPAPMMLLAMFMNADDRFDLGRDASEACQSSASAWSPNRERSDATAMEGAVISDNRGTRWWPRRAVEEEDR